MAKKNKVSKRKSKARKGGHNTTGVGFSLGQTTFDNGCGYTTKRKTRSANNRKAIAEQI
jgi:hypothetical protein